MLSIVTPAEMRTIDSEADEPVEVLIRRAGWATARAARRLLSQTYGSSSGRRVTVLAGPGNNGADGRAAAEVLHRAGVACRVVDVGRQGIGSVPGCDLVIDAAFGTGVRGEVDLPDAVGAPVLAVDIASGVDGLTGELPGRALVAAATVTFAALKPGLLLGAGPSHCGAIEVVDIGLELGRARAWLLTPDDLRRWPLRPRHAHKWGSACWVVGGSAGMTGAPRLAAIGAQRAGAGYVRLSVPGVAPGDVEGPLEVVGIDLPRQGWAEAVLADHERVAAFVVGPGLGTDPSTDAEVRRLLDGLRRPVVLDGDGLRAVSGHLDSLRSRPAATVLTPHDGEFARLVGSPPGPDRLLAARDLAERTGAVVLLKGPTTVVADPDGRASLSTSGDQRLASAGSGDVLAGIIAAGLARGADPWLTAGLAAEAHGRAAAAGSAIGLIASDIAEHLGEVLAPRGDDETGPPHPQVSVGVPVR